MMLKRDRVKIHEAVAAGDFTPLLKLEWNVFEWEELIYDIRHRQTIESNKDAKRVMRDAVITLMDISANEYEV